MNQSQKKLTKIEKRIKLLSPPNPSDFVGGKNSAAYKTALANWKKPSNYPKGGPLPLLRSQGYKPNIQNELDIAIKEQQRLIKHIQTPSFKKGPGPGRQVKNKDYIPNFRTGAELQIKRFQAIDYRSGEDPSPGASALNPQGLTFNTKYTPGVSEKNELKNELGPTPETKPTGTVASAGNSNLQINPFSGEPVTEQRPVKSTSTAQPTAAGLTADLRALNTLNKQNLRGLQASNVTLAIMRKEQQLSKLKGDTHPSLTGRDHHGVGYSTGKEARDWLKINKLR